MHRSSSKIAQVLRVLKEKEIVTNAELNTICFRYGSVIHRLRLEGHRIVSRKVNNTGLWEFQYYADEVDVTTASEVYATGGWFRKLLGSK